ncbi:MAG: hydrogenase expression/formation protein HypE [SAR324 cluster bacterium]|nr:hydrogenase expression/formation protein HypE [SAR324 cluster bacterium]
MSLSSSTPHPNSSGSAKVVLGHGSGGKLSQDLLETVFFPYFKNSILDENHDGAILRFGNQKLAFSTDSFVVNPLFFHGGNIGDLAINGTINDLSMCGALPQYLAASFILEEGFPLHDLKKIVQSMHSAAQAANVLLVTGDTKVVEKGKGDGVFINTTGIGTVGNSITISPKNAAPGDVVLINGNIGDHGIAIMSEREGLEFETTIESDTAPLNDLIQNILEVSPNVHVLRDPTRGGLASTLNEIAAVAQYGILLEEKQLPIQPAVMAACEILGLDPLHIANEGKCLVFVPENEGDVVLQKMRQHPLGKESAVIGKVIREHPGKVLLRTAIESLRMLDMPEGEQLPRIC